MGAFAFTSRWPVEQKAALEEVEQMLEAAEARDKAA